MTTTTDELVTIEQASSECLEGLLGLLSQVDLPHEGVNEYLGGFLVARDKSGKLIGCIGLERHGQIGLLRSAAVLPEYRGRWIGGKLVQELLTRATAEGIAEIALLTTTAKDYFAKKFDFKEAERFRYEQRLRRSPEWNLPRCSSAAFMTLKLKT